MNNLPEMGVDDALLVMHKYYEIADRLQIGESFFNKQEEKWFKEIDEFLNDSGLV